MKLMKVFQIQNDYQKHKQRLKSIKSLDSKKKVSTNFFQNVDKINNYKRKKSCSIYFHDYQKQRNISQKNQQLHNVLNKVYSKDFSQKICRSINEHSNVIFHRTSSQNSIRSHESSRLKEQNVKINKKLSLAKSSYKKFRQQRPRKKIITETGHRQEVIKLLQFQLGCKPKVLFPCVNLKQDKSKKLNNSTRK